MRKALPLTFAPVSDKLPVLQKRHAVNDYAIAFATVALMFALRSALTPILGHNNSFTTFFFGNVFISMRYGIKPALLALLISFPMAIYFFTGNHSLIPRTTNEAVANLFTLLNSLTVILLAERQRSTYRELAEKEQATRHHAEALEKETQARRQIEREREGSLRELENANMRLQRAMKETHHRVKNNLQVVAALIEMQEDPDFPPAALASLSRIGQHVRTLATVHDVLTLQSNSETEVTDVPVKSIILRLLDLMETTLEGRRILHNIDELWLSAEQAASLAMLINELVNNAIKHGNGDIEVTLHSVDGEAHLEVCDDGPGFPPDFDPHQAARTGLELIDSMSRWDLRGSVAYGNQPKGGARVQVTFPLPAVGK